jgi:hypothetical protein
MCERELGALHTQLVEELAPLGDQRVAQRMWEELTMDGRYATFTALGFSISNHSSYRTAASALSTSEDNVPHLCDCPQYTSNLAVLAMLRVVRHEQQVPRWVRMQALSYLHAAGCDIRELAVEDLVRRALAPYKSWARRHITPRDTTHGVQYGHPADTWNDWPAGWTASAPTWGTEAEDAASDTDDTNAAQDAELAAAAGNAAPVNHAAQIDPAVVDEWAAELDADVDAADEDPDPNTDDEDTSAVMTSGDVEEGEYDSDTESDNNATVAAHAMEVDEEEERRHQAEADRAHAIQNMAAGCNHISDDDEDEVTVQTPSPAAAIPGNQQPALPAPTMAAGPLATYLHYRLDGTAPPANPSTDNAADTAPHPHPLDWRNTTPAFVPINPALVHLPAYLTMYPSLQVASDVYLDTVAYHYRNAASSYQRAASLMQQASAVLQHAIDSSVGSTTTGGNRLSPGHARIMRRANAAGDDANHHHTAAQLATSRRAAMLQEASSARTAQELEAIIAVLGPAGQAAADAAGSRGAAA